ncbi:MAG: histidine triad nucleotide-binding protein [Candidatus Pacebacteria bacterium]|nr:histidine triad nucleotide-binding protein [Candidatus Paceibacterota bacterium]
MEDCIFCKIVNRELPGEIVYEDDRVLAFLDIHPKAPIHLLLVPKSHLASIQNEGSEDVAGELVSAAKHIAKEKGLSSYKLVFNVGREAGQTVNHLHLHLLSGGPSELTI